MDFVLFSIGAALLVAAGALFSGGWSPAPPHGVHVPPDKPREDDFGHDLAALLGYQGAPQREEDDDET